MNSEAYVGIDVSKALSDVKVLPKNKAQQMDLVARFKCHIPLRHRFFWPQQSLL